MSEPGARSRARHIGWWASTLAIARRECRDSLAGRWFLLHTVSFSALAGAVSIASLANPGMRGRAGFDTTAAGLVNLVMLIVPLMCLTAGAGSIAGERERGTLLHVLAQPIARSELMVGKMAGLIGAIWCSLLIGFGLSAGYLAWRTGGSGAGVYAALVAWTLALAVAMLAVGLLLSAASGRTGLAIGLALLVWLVLVFLGDLGLMAGTMIYQLRASEVFALGIANPLMAFKMAAVGHMSESLDLLGPVGVYASQTLGDRLPLLTASVLLAWVALPLAAATAVFLRRDPV